MTRAVGRQGGEPRPPGPGRPARTPVVAFAAGPLVAPVASLVGLVVVAMVTLSLSGGRLPFGLDFGAGSSGGGIVSRTPTPSNQVVVPEDPRAHVPGMIVYVKAGNVWLQSGTTATQLTDSGADATPSFSADGASVYFIRSRPVRALWPVGGGDHYYSLQVPSVMRVPTTGGPAVSLFDGLVIGAGANRWAGWIREPVVSPDGRTIAVVSDLPLPYRSDVVLQLLDVATGKLSKPALSETAPLGHQDPAWRPDGRLLLYVRNDRDGAKGTPAIYAYDPATKVARELTGPGYLQPAWSSDGRWIAATKTSAFGTDVVILNASTGAEVLRVTSDGTSWAPTWSPKGDGIAFLHENGQVVDLRLAELTGTGTSWTLGEALNLTTSAGLDSASRPGWFIPADQLPKPSAFPAAGSPQSSPTQP